MNRQALENPKLCVGGTPFKRVDSFAVMQVYNLLFLFHFALFIKCQCQLL